MGGFFALADGALPPRRFEGLWSATRVVCSPNLGAYQGHGTLQTFVWSGVMLQSARCLACPGVAGDEPRALPRAIRRSVVLSRIIPPGSFELTGRMVTWDTNRTNRQEGVDGGQLLGVQEVRA